MYIPPVLTNKVTVKAPARWAMIFLPAAQAGNLDERVG